MWKESLQSEWGCQGYSFLPSLCWAMVLLAIFMVMGALMMGNLCPDKIQSTAVLPVYTAQRNGTG